MRRNRNACNLMLKRFNDKGVRWDASRAAAARKAADEVKHLLLGLVLSMKRSVGIHLAHARASVTERGKIVRETTRSVEVKVQDIVTGQSVPSADSLDFSRVPPSRDVLLHIWIDAAPNGDSSAVPVSEEVQGASSACS